MLGLLHKGGLTMTIHRTGKDGKAVPQPDFAYEPTAKLADVVIKAWQDPGFRSDLLDRNGPWVTPLAVTTATTAINNAGIKLTRAVVITEDEYDNDYQAQAPDEVVFVLPNTTRVSNLSLSATDLKETAKLLMAATPNGI
jgi:hypothetical protein